MKKYVTYGLLEIVDMLPDLVRGDTDGGFFFISSGRLFHAMSVFVEIDFPSSPFWFG